MSESVSQTQKGGAESTNVQAGQVVIHQHSLTYTDVKEIALDVFKSNFEQLSTVARETARSRAEEVTDEFLVQLRERNPTGISQAETPQFQLNLLTLQREYARTGDKDLGKLLVDLLIDVTKEKGRTVVQIVLEECLTVAPKLTAEQVAALAVIFLMRYCSHTRLVSPALLREYFQLTSPFVELLTKNDTTYRHLEYSGCGSVGFGSIPLAMALSETYPALFCAPFTREEFAVVAAEFVDSPIVIASFIKNDMFQFAAANRKTFDAVMEELGVREDVAANIRNFWDARRLPQDQVKIKALEWAPEMKGLFEIWDNCSMSGFTLTSVGLGIAHAAVRSKTGFGTDLSVWVN